MSSATHRLAAADRLVAAFLQSAVLSQPAAA